MVFDLCGLVGRHYLSSESNITLLEGYISNIPRAFLSTQGNIGFTDIFYVWINLRSD
jgi:hypothetical protein